MSLPGLRAVDVSQSPTEKSELSYRHPPQVINTVPAPEATEARAGNRKRTGQTGKGVALSLWWSFFLSVKKIRRQEPALSIMVQATGSRAATSSSAPSM